MRACSHGAQSYAAAPAVKDWTHLRRAFLIALSLVLSFGERFRAALAGSLFETTAFIAL
jgi:hypothetical protein